MESAQGDSAEKIMPIIHAYLGIARFYNHLEGSHFNEIVTNIINLHNKAPKQFQPPLRSLVVNQLSYTDLVARGMVLTMNQYRYPKKAKGKRILPFTKFKPHIPKTKEKVSYEMIKKIIDTLIMFSETGRNPNAQSLDSKFIKVAEDPTSQFCASSTYSLNLNRNQIFAILKAGDENFTIGLSTFYSYVPSNFGLPEKRTDICTLCHKGKLVELVAKNSSALANLNIQDVNKTLEALHNHQQILGIQKKAYEREIQELTDNSCMVIVDFKENIAIGGSSEETSQIFWSKSAISVLGFCVIYRINGIFYFDFYDFLSSILNHNSQFSGSCLLLLLKKPKLLNIQNLTIWSDNGPHFRSMEFLYYVFVLVPKVVPGRITFNRFCEYHGKSLVDGHFGVLSCALKDLKNKTTINTINDLQNVFQTNENFCRNARLPKLLERTPESNTKGLNEVFFFIYDGENKPDLGKTGEASEISSSVTVSGIKQ